VSDKDPKIRFAGQEIPSHQVWPKLEMMNQALDVIDRFNGNRPALATDYTRNVAREVRNRLKRIEVIMPRPKKTLDLEDKARALLQMHTPEEVVEILNKQDHQDYDLQGLIFLAGTEPYIKSLANEAELLSQNKISWEQMAHLWNEAKRPIPGRPFWDARTVEQVVTKGTLD